MRRLLLPRLLALAAVVVCPAAHAVRPLPFHYDLYTFRGDHGGTDVVASFAVPAGRLEYERVGRRTRYRFDVSLILTDTARDEVIRAEDSVYVEVRYPLDDDHLLFTYVELETGPSRTTVQRVIMSDATTPGIGQLYSTGFDVPDYSGDTLMLSDVALGHPDPVGGWRRDDVTVALLPTSQFPSADFDVFYEIYNLPPGHAYRTEVAVERLDARGAPAESGRAAVRFRGEGRRRPDGTIAELRRVRTSLGRGKHRITVTVTDVASGESVSRSRLFTVRGGGRATMVPALPR